MFERQHHQAVRKNADYDGGPAFQQVRRISHNRRHAFAAEFRQVDPAQEPDRHPHERRKQQNLAATHNRVGHAAARFSYRLRQFGEKIPVDGSAAIKHQVAEDEEENQNRDKSAHAGHRQHEVAYEFSPAQPAAYHPPTSLPFCVVTTISRRASPFRMNVSRKRTSPSAISDCKYKSPVASVNSLAITAAIEQPGAKSEAAILGVLPITMVTAMVSPRARASARKIEPMMPVFAKGTTTFQVDSHRVEPRANAASRWSRGTESRTSRDTEMM